MLLHLVNVWPFFNFFVFPAFLLYLQLFVLCLFVSPEALVMLFNNPQSTWYYFRVCVYFQFTHSGYLYFQLFIYIISPLHSETLYGGLNLWLGSTSFLPVSLDLSIDLSKIILSVTESFSGVCLYYQFFFCWSSRLNVNKMVYLSSMIYLFQSSLWPW